MRSRSLITTPRILALIWCRRSKAVLTIRFFTFPKRVTQITPSTKVVRPSTSPNAPRGGVSITILSKVLRATARISRKRLLERISGEARVDPPATITLSFGIEVFWEMAIRSGSPVTSGEQAAIRLGVSAIPVIRGMEGRRRSASINRVRKPISAYERAKWTAL